MVFSWLLPVGFCNYPASLMSTDEAQKAGCHALYNLRHIFQSIIQSETFGVPCFKSLFAHLSQSFAIAIHLILSLSICTHSEKNNTHQRDLHIPGYTHLL